jgi:hypothetical protein
VEFDTIRGHYRDGTWISASDFEHAQIFGFRHDDSFEYWFSLTPRGLTLKQIFVNSPLYNSFWGDEAIGRIEIELPPERASVADLYAGLAIEAMNSLLGSVADLPEAVFCDVAATFLRGSRSVEVVTQITVTETDRGVLFSIFALYDDVLGFSDIRVEYVQDAHGGWEVAHVTLRDDYRLRPTPTQLQHGDSIGEWTVIRHIDTGTYSITQLSDGGGIAFVNVLFESISVLGVSDCDSYSEYVGVCAEFGYKWHFAVIDRTTLQLESVAVPAVGEEPGIYVYPLPRQEHMGYELVSLSRSAAAHLLEAESDLAFVAEVYACYSDDGSLVFTLNASFEERGYYVKITVFEMTLDDSGEWEVALYLGWG